MFFLSIENEIGVASDDKYEWRTKVISVKVVIHGTRG
jgi:hypothetical protein